MKARVQAARIMLVKRTALPILGGGAGLKKSEAFLTAHCRESIELTGF